MIRRLLHLACTPIRVAIRLVGPRAMPFGYPLAPEDE
ncbi:hypothetical protein SEA_EYRE_51 [Gordonia phage Eyre]|uniref:Uncharacterized protein n=1 Tax=Gordonia phage Eyre TaxID=1887646 RepID=A0A1B3B016_9CAUD|nr:hypothetical protein BIZ73_gp51 [Gordonia phage Eyre]AOE44331.1 hypothetical protein SEA_EYRE_51 [Gordonia phage Eyre]